MSHPLSLCRVTILEGKRDVRVVDVQPGISPIKIGRLSSAHLRLEHDSVSRIHAVIERGADGSSVNLVDLGSAAGTFINGTRISREAIEDGDELGFGEVRVRVDFIAAEALHTPEGRTANEPLTLMTSTNEALVTAADGSAVEPYTLQGYYDDGGNYIPGYYDEEGAYHLGYGYYDEAGAWSVAFGYYDAEGTWVDTEHAIASLDELGWNGPSNIDYYTDAFFDGKGGDTLEVAMLWADQVLAVNTYSTPRSVIIGASRRADFTLEDQSLTSQEFPLVMYAEGTYQLVVTAQMTGMIQNGDQRYTLAEAIEQGIARQGGVPGGFVIPLGSRTSARVDIGDVTFLMHFTEQPAIFWPMFTVGAAALSILGFIAISALLQGSFVAIALTSPIDPNGLELDAFSADDRFVQAMILPEQEEEEETKEDDGAGEEAAAKHAGEEGQAGKEDSEQVNKELAIKGPSDNQEIQLKRTQDTQVAMNSGALAVMGDMVSSPFGTSSESVGSDAIHALGNLEGDGAGEARGFGGLGMAGAGRGGGGVSERGIGMADVGTRGKGGKGGGGSGGYGGSAGDLGQKKGLVPKLVPGTPKVVGSLDKEIIRRVVRQHRSEIRYCYEKELQKNPKLSGTVNVKFVIAGTGNVMSATISSTDLNNSSVEQCMTGKIRRWTFPEPTGGGIVNVNYPFKFSS